MSCTGLSSINSVSTLTASNDRNKPSSYYEKKYFALWKARALQKQNKTAFPSTEECLNKIFLVHATDILPQNNTLKAGSVYCFRKDNNDNQATIAYYSGHRKTIHFALGGLARPHLDGNWEQKKYIIVCPLKSLIDKVANIFPYDTYILGDLVLDPSATIIVPEQTSTEQLTNPKIIKYSPQIDSIRKIVDGVIQEQHGWLIQTDDQMGGIDSSARIEQFRETEVSSPQFFHSLLKAYPNLSFGAHMNGITGENWRIGQIDYLISNLLKAYLLYSKGGSWNIVTIENYQVEDLEFLAKLFKHQTKKIEEYVAALPSSHTQQKAVLKDFLREIEKWRWVIQLDLEARLDFKNFHPRQLSNADCEALESWLQKQLDNFDASTYQCTSPELSRYSYEEEWMQHRIISYDSTHQCMRTTQLAEAKNLITQRHQNKPGYNLNPPFFDIVSKGIYCSHMSAEELEEFLMSLNPKQSEQSMINFIAALDRYYNHHDEPSLQLLRELSQKITVEEREVLNKKSTSRYGNEIPSFLDRLKKRYQQFLQMPIQQENRRAAEEILALLKIF